MTSHPAEREIRDLVARYCEAVNRRDAERWGETWSADGEWTLGDHSTQGREAIVARWSELMGAIPWVHQVPSVGVVEATRTPSRTGSGRWVVSEIVRRPSSTNLILGLYHDDYVHEASAWRFARRRFEVLYRGEPELSGSLVAFSGRATD